MVVPVFSLFCCTIRCFCSKGRTCVVYAIIHYKILEQEFCLSCIYKIRQNLISSLVMKFGAKCTLIIPKFYYSNISARISKKWYKVGNWGNQLGGILI